jgi:NitT/TauT family transport system substrate-binding protein
MLPTRPSTRPPAPATSRRAVLGYAAGAATVPLLAACTKRTAPAGAGSGTVVLVHAAKDPLLLWSVSYLAQDAGYYKKEGLTVKRVPLGGGPAAMTGLLSGEGHANLSAPGELLSAVAKGRRLKVLLAHTNVMPSILVVGKEFAERVGVTADSPLADRRAAIGKVRGARFGITAPGSITDGFTRLALRQAGIDPAKGARIVPLQTAANSLAALANGQIDGFVGVPPVAEKAILELGAVQLLVNQTGEIEGADRVQGMTLQARTEDVEANPDLYRALVRADVRAMRALVDDPEEAGRLLRRTRFSQLEQPIWEHAWKLVQHSWRSPIVPRDSLAAWFDNRLVADADGKTFAYDEVLDMRFAEEALAVTGWKPAVRA